MIAAVALLVSLVCLVVSAYLWLETSELAKRVRAALDEQRERADLMWAIQETERKLRK